MLSTKDAFEVWDKEIDPRIDFLRNNNHHLEAYYLYSNTIEFLLRMAIMSQEIWNKNLLKRSGINFKVLKESDLEDRTLGELIKFFSRYCDDPLIIGELSRFNAFRKKVLHNLLKESISNLNKEADKIYVTYNSLVSKICRYNIKINKKHINHYNRKLKS